MNWNCLKKSQTIAILGLSSCPRQEFTKVRTKSEALRVTFHAPESVGKCEGMNSHSQMSFHFGCWNLMDSKFSKGDCNGQNSLDWKFPYTIGKFLERRWLKWVCTWTWIMAKWGPIVVTCNVVTYDVVKM